MSELYLCHLARPVCDHRPARHYLGFSQDAAKREQDYRAMRVGYHGRLMLAAVERGIDFVIARVWKNADKRDEKLLRDLHNNPKLCPICNPSLQLTTRLNDAGRYQTYPIADPRRVRYGDLRVLRHKQVKPARRRVRLDGTTNYSAADDDVIQSQSRDLSVAHHYDTDFAPFGFDADIPF